MNERFFTNQEAPIEDILDAAFTDMEDIATELRESMENTPENLQGAEAYQNKEEAADSIDGLEKPKVPEELKGRVIKWTEKKAPPKNPTRGARRDAVMNKLAGIQELLDSIDNPTDEIESFKSEFEQVFDTIDNLELGRS